MTDEQEKLDERLRRVEQLEGIAAVARGVAHDLNNVLTPLMFGMDLLKPALSDPAHLRTLEAMQANVQRGAEIVQQLRSFARAAQGEDLDNGNGKRAVEQPDRPEPPPGHDELVLVIDDEASVREMMKATLKASGYRVVTAQDGKHALELCGRMVAEIDAVVSDIHMPTMDGPSIIKELQRRDPHLRFIVISGSMEGSDIPDEAKSLVFLPKPLDRDQLLFALHDLLNAPAKK